MNKPFSQACENNRGPISNVLVRLLSKRASILELGSGTGQHAVWFAQQLPNIHWQTSDREENHAGIRQWLDDSGLDNIGYPILSACISAVTPGQQYLLTRFFHLTRHT